MAADLTLPRELLEYTRVVSSFLQGDLEKLRECCHQVSSAVCRILADFRLRIRAKDLTVSYLRELTSLQLPGVLLAELHFNLGMAWEILKQDEEAQKSFALAAAIYREHACPQKGLRSFYNSVVAESRVRPHKNYIPEYQAVITASLQIGNHAFAGIARSMLSREYQARGLFDQALEFIDQALTDLQNERGTIHYYHALLQKAHVLFDLGREREAEPLLRETELASFLEIRAARILLQTHLDPTRSWDANLEKDLLPTWRNRVPALVSKRRVVSGGTNLPTHLELELMRLAYNGPIDKWDLIARLYPEDGDSLALENRFKNLVARVRKKYPETLSCIEGRYSIATLPPEVVG